MVGWGLDFGGKELEDDVTQGNGKIDPKSAATGDFWYQFYKIISRFCKLDFAELLP